ncbi:MAG TPA: B12-binding domain-containing protein [Longimicrobium sp.]|nr:B12-binding domain-containing protein [Longimicrobium sp.]
MATAELAAAGEDRAAGRDDAANRFLDAIVAGNRRRAFEVADGALAGGMDIRALYLDVFQPALRDVGRLWQQNRITVADEHLATAITQAAMARLYERLFASATGTGPLLVAACADSERHEVGLRMVCDILELEGWDTVFLGAAVPTADLVRMVCQRRPRVVALSAAIGPNVARVEAAIRAIREGCGDAQPLIAVGGRAFAADPELATRLGADLTASDAAEAARRLKERFAA